MITTVSQLDQSMMNPITVPSEWNLVLDRELAESIWELKPNQVQAELAFMDLNQIRSSFARLLETAAKFCSRWTDLPPYFEPSVHSIAENIEFLTAVITQAKQCEPFRQRILENLAICRWVEAERKRIISNFISDQGKGWQYPVTCLRDRFLAAGNDLQESLDVEIEGFAAFRNTEMKRRRETEAKEGWFEV